MHLIQKTPISLNILIMNSTPTHIQKGPFKFREFAEYKNIVNVLWVAKCC